jgi:hypothetical protein
VHGLEHLHDVRPLGLRGDGMLAGRLGRGARRVQESISVARIALPGADSAARDTVLSSSRMLPGQW